MSNPSLEWKKIWFVLVVVFLDALGAGLIIPVLPSLVLQLHPRSRLGSSLDYGLLMSAYALCLFLLGPLLARASDSFGRRPVIMITLCGASLDYFVMSVTGSFFVLLVGRAVAGCCGANMSTASAYVADMLEPHERTRGFGMVGAAFGVGFIVGPLLGGVAAMWGARIPFFLAAFLSSATFLYAYFVLPESLARSARRGFGYAQLNPFGPITNMLTVQGVQPLLAALFFYQFAIVMVQSVWVLLLTQRLAWQTGSVGVSLMVFGVLAAVVQGGLAEPSERLLGSNGSAMLGFAGALAGNAIFIAARSSFDIYLGLVISSLGWLIVPTIQSKVSACIGPDRQGEWQGAMMAIWGFAMVAAPPFATWAFQARTHSPPGGQGALVFYLACALLAGSVVILRAGMGRPLPDQDISKSVNTLQTR